MLVEGESDRRARLLRIEMLGIDQRHRLGVVVDPRDEAAECFIAHHAGQGGAFDIGQLVER